MGQVWEEMPRTIWLASCVRCVACRLSRSHVSAAIGLLVIMDVLILCLGATLFLLRKGLLGVSRAVAERELGAAYRDRGQEMGQAPHISGV